VAVYGLGYRADNFRGMQHANLDRVNPYVFHHRVDLLDQHIHRHWMNRPDALGVLGCEGRDGCHAKAPQRRKCFQVRLYAGTSAAV
jgi:hypothetical protein